MEEDDKIQELEEWLTPIEDIRDKIWFQLHELFCFYQEENFW